MTNSHEQTARAYILSHRYQGFDELADNLGMTKDEVKNIWNSLKLGWHMTPTTLVDFRRLANNRYVVLKDVVVFIAPATPIVVSEGTITDFASVPRLLHFLIDKDDNDIAIGALVHDVLYQSEWFSRRVSDSILLQLMKYRGAPLWKRIAVYLGVRMGGWIVWFFHTKEEVEVSNLQLFKDIKRYNKDITI